MLDLFASASHILASAPPLAPILVMLAIYNLLPPAPGETDVWVRVSARD